MKSMKDFAARQLTKKQMNEVKGGILCTLYDENHMVLMRGQATYDATYELNEMYGQFGWSASCDVDFGPMIQRDATYMAPRPSLFH